MLMEAGCQHQHTHVHQAHDDITNYGDDDNGEPSSSPSVAVTMTLFEEHVRATISENEVTCRRAMLRHAAASLVALPGIEPMRRFLRRYVIAAYRAKSELRRRQRARIERQEALSRRGVLAAAAAHVNAAIVPAFVEGEESMFRTQFHRLTLLSCYGLARVQLGHLLQLSLDQLYFLDRDEVGRRWQCLFRCEPEEQRQGEQQGHQNQETENERNGLRDQRRKREVAGQAGQETSSPRPLAVTSLRVDHPRPPAEPAQAGTGRAATRGGPSLVKTTRSGGDATTQGAPVPVPASAEAIISSGCHSPLEQSVDESSTSTLGSSANAGTLRELAATAVPLVLPLQCQKDDVATTHTIIASSSEVVVGQGTRTVEVASSPTCDTVHLSPLAADFTKSEADDAASAFPPLHDHQSLPDVSSSSPDAPSSPVLRVGMVEAEEDVYDRAVRRHREGLQQVKTQHETLYGQLRDVLIRQRHYTQATSAPSMAGDDDMGGMGNEYSTRRDLIASARSISVSPSARSALIPSRPDASQRAGGGRPGGSFLYSLAGTALLSGAASSGGQSTADKSAHNGGEPSVARTNAAARSAANLAAAVAATSAPRSQYEAYALSWLQRHNEEHSPPRTPLEGPPLVRKGTASTLGAASRVVVVKQAGATSAVALYTNSYAVLELSAHEHVHRQAVAAARLWGLGRIALIRSIAELPWHEEAARWVLEHDQEVRRARLMVRCRRARDIQALLELAFAEHCARRQVERAADATLRQGIEAFMTATSTEAQAGEREALVAFTAYCSAAAAAVAGPAAALDVADSRPEPPDPTLPRVRAAEESPENALEAAMLKVLMMKTTGGAGAAEQRTEARIISHTLPESTVDADVMSLAGFDDDDD